MKLFKSNSPLGITQEAINNFLSHNGNPKNFLGFHSSSNKGKVCFRTFQPNASSGSIINLKTKKIHLLSAIGDQGVFACELPKAIEDYQIEWNTNDSNHTYTISDPYSFDIGHGNLDYHLMGQGTHYKIYDVLGAHSKIINNTPGVYFSVWAPNARGVSIVGDFNNWDGRRTPMIPTKNGIWEIFIPHLEAGTLYKYEVFTQNGECLSKQDPMARFSQLRPLNASVVWESNYTWNDKEWMEQNGKQQEIDQPVSIYEVHSGSWKRPSDGREFFNFRELATELIPYIIEMGFTHIELMPISEHPLDESWGYQVTGYFSCTSRHGTPDDFKYFVDQCHKKGISVILDWVPAHFPKNADCLGRFDGTALYEHEDSRLGEHPHWGTYIFNYGRTEVSNFLIASALYWLKEFHIDGLRVDAVASMLYLDYGRNEGEWIPNKNDENINLEAIELLKHLNSIMERDTPHAQLIAEESTSFGGITQPVSQDGLGFSYKWNMGWMNDILDYFSRDSIHRKYHHGDLTFGMLYAYSENFTLVFSHDEVVHGKGSLIEKMPGDSWQKFANLRALYGFMYGHPGKKLLFMGSEIAQGLEWNSQSQLSWEQLDIDLHSGVQNLVKDLNHTYKANPALWDMDQNWEGFQWLDCENAKQSVLGFCRNSKEGDRILVLANFTPNTHNEYVFGVPEAGFYQEILNTDSKYYQGSDKGNHGGVRSKEVAHNEFSHQVKVTLPPLSVSFLKLQR